MTPRSPGPWSPRLAAQEPSARGTGRGRGGARPRPRVRGGGKKGEKRQSPEGRARAGHSLQTAAICSVAPGLRSGWAGRPGALSAALGHPGTAWPGAPPAARCPRRAGATPGRASPGRFGSGSEGRVGEARRGGCARGAAGSGSGSGSGRPDPRVSGPGAVSGRGAGRGRGEAPGAPGGRRIAKGCGLAGMAEPRRKGAGGRD